MIAMTNRWITRAETEADVPGVREVEVAAFPTPEEADLVDALRASSAWLPGLSIVSADAAEPTRVVGHALLTRCHVSASPHPVDDVDDAAEPALALAPCAVLPEHQRSGAGSAAIEAALVAAREQGERLVLVLGHPEYYPRFGFVPASRYGIRAPMDVPDEAMMALPLDDARPIPGGVIHYPPPFGI